MPETTLEVCIVHPRIYIPLTGSRTLEEIKTGQPQRIWHYTLHCALGDAFRLRCWQWGREGTDGIYLGPS